MDTPWRTIKGAEPDALKGASPVLNAGNEETCLEGNAPCSYATGMGNFLPALAGGTPCRAELITQGRAMFVDITPFRLRRFAEHQPIQGAHEYVLPEGFGHRV